MGVAHDDSPRQAGLRDLGGGTHRRGPPADAPLLRADGPRAAQRTRGNTRLYSQQDIARLQQVRRLVNELGINVSGVEVILGMSRQIEELQSELTEARHELTRSCAAESAKQ
ncbi:MAG: chaperone modulator CbpM [Dehalococcoidia bacterium]